MIASKWVLPLGALKTRRVVAVVMRSGDHCDYQNMLSLEWKKASARAARDQRPLHVELQKQWRLGSARSRQHERRVALLSMVHNVKLSADSTQRRF